jgi:hypothetical protein
MKLFTRCSVCVIVPDPIFVRVVTPVLGSV